MHLSSKNQFTQRIVGRGLYPVLLSKVLLLGGAGLTALVGEACCGGLLPRALSLVAFLAIWLVPHCLVQRSAWYV